MKKIFSILALAIITAAGFTACNDDDEWVDPNGEPLKVISNETQFQAAASTGSVVVDTKDPVTVTSNDNGWVSTTVNGNTIEVAVTENPSLDGRVATLTIKAGTKKTDVSIVQSGAIFQMGVTIISVGDENTNVVYPVRANLPVTFTKVGDFFNFTYDEETGELSVTFTENTTGHIRQGYIDYTCGDTSGRIPVNQCDFATDVAGDGYEFTFLNLANQQYQYFNAVISGDEDDCVIELTGTGLEIPVTYNSTDCTIKMRAGEVIGEFDDDGTIYKVATVMWDTNEGYLTWNNSVSITAPVELAQLQTGELVNLMQFADDGSWAGYNITTLRFELFKALPLSSANRDGAIAQMMSPYLLKVLNVPAATTAAKTAKGMKKKAMRSTPAQAFSVIPDTDNVKVAY